VFNTVELYCLLLVSSFTLCARLLFELVCKCLESVEGLEGLNQEIASISQLL